MTNLHDHYNDYVAVLDQADTVMRVAECHGVFTGLLAINSQASIDDCVTHIFDDNFDPESALHRACLETLTEIFKQTRIDLNGPGIEFSLLLSDDADDLLQRAFDLQEWTQGFLFGLGLAGLPFLTDPRKPDEDEDPAVSEVREMINDLIEISHLSLDGISGSDENEKDLSELVEYVRVGVLYIQDECNPLMQSNSLH